MMAAALTLAITAVAPSAAYACSCVGYGVAQHLERADLVVRATIESRDGGLRLPVLGTGDVTYHLRVHSVFKGEAGRVAEVRSASDGAACGLEIEVGREYVVFADRAGDGLYAGLCGGTTDASPATLRALEQAAGPPGAPGKDPIGAQPGLRLERLLPVPILALAMAAFLVVRRTLRAGGGAETGPSR